MLLTSRIGLEFPLQVEKLVKATASTFLDSVRARKNKA